MSDFVYLTQQEKTIFSGKCFVDVELSANISHKGQTDKSVQCTGCKETSISFCSVHSTMSLGFTLR